MRPLDLALQYMDIVFGGKNIEELRLVLSENCSFKGPFYAFDTAESYIQSLQSHPPEGFQFEIIRTFQDESSACLMYQFSKPGVSTPMAQLFETSEGKINRIVLIFDAGAFT